MCLICAIRAYIFALSYCFGQAMSSPSSLAKSKAKFGFLKDSLANKTKSAFSSAMISSAWDDSVIMPTAPVKIPVSFLILSAKGT